MKTGEDMRILLCSNVISIFIIPCYPKTFLYYSIMHNTHRKSKEIIKNLLDGNLGQSKSKPSVYSEEDKLFLLCPQVIDTSALLSLRGPQIDH